LWLLNCVDVAVAAASTTGNSDQRQRDKAGYWFHIAPVSLDARTWAKSGPGLFLEDGTSGHYSGKLIPIQQQAPRRDSEAVGKTINLSHGGNKALVTCDMGFGIHFAWLDSDCY
jgi:hypothetical protein